MTLMSSDLQSHLSAVLDKHCSDLPEPRLHYVTCCAVVDMLEDSAMVAGHIHVVDAASFQALLAEWGWTLSDDEREDVWGTWLIGIQHTSSILRTKCIPWSTPWTAPAEGVEK